MSDSSSAPAPSGLPSKLSFFLCHASEDKPIVQELHALLERCGVKAWMDRDASPGRPWESVIPAAIKHHEVFAIFISQKFNEKYHSSMFKDRSRWAWVRREVEYARALQKTIFIIRLERANIPSDLHQSWTHMDLFSQDSRGRFMAKLRLLKEFGVPPRSRDLLDVYENLLEKDLRETNDWAALVRACAMDLAVHQQLVMLGPQGGSARGIANAIVSRYGGEVTTLSPPEDPNATEAEYCKALGRKALGPVDDFQGLLEKLRRRSSGRHAHLIHVEHDGGNLEQLRKLGRYLHELQVDLYGATPIHVLAVGGMAAASLLMQQEGGSVWRAATSRVIPNWSKAAIGESFSASERPIDTLFRRKRPIQPR